VRYTVWSRGRLIGETDLGFVRVIEQSRSGSFHPTDEGERLMSVIAAPSPAMRAYLHRDAVDALGESLVQPSLRGSTLFADLAEELQQLHSLDLELRREDGSVVPTSDIGIQDTHHLLALADEEDGVDAWSWDEDDDLFATTELDYLREADVMPDADVTEEAPGDWVDDLCTEWTREDLEAPRFPRYQIHVLLLHGDEIP
jgi:hypothetical protein